MVGAFVAVCLAVAGLSAQPARAADTGSITGQVFTKALNASQVPASSVFIYLSYSETVDGGYQSVDSDPATDRDGYSFDDHTFSLTGLKAGFYKFEVAGVGDDSYQREYYNDADSLSGATPIQVGTGAVTADDMVLEPAGQITGKVTDRAGNPLANASISFQDSERGGGGYATTDAAGNFTSEKDDDGFGVGLVRGDYRVSARLDDYTNPDAPSYEERYWQNSATYAGATPVTVVPGGSTDQINIVLDVAPRIRLTVKDPAGTPLPNVDVGIYTFYDGAWGPYQAGPNTTDTDGVYRKTVRIGDRYKFFITPPAGVDGVTEWYDNAYTEATAREVKATAYGDVLNIEIRLGDAPAVTGATPTVTGTPEVGTTLTANPGTWGPAGVSLGYQWLVNNVAIGGATQATYTPVEADVTKALTVKVTGTLANYTTTAKTSAATAAVTAPAVVAPVIAGAAPTISGTARSGKTLTVSPGSWGPSGVAVGYQWLANGVAIPGATATSIKLTNSQAGTRITVAATGSLAGASPVTTTSAATATVKGVLAAKKVSISGTPKVGKKLRAKTGSWGPSPVTSSYAWYRNGKKISGQKKISYKLGKADAGKRITVRVTQKKSNYISASTLSSKTKKVKKR